MAHSECFTAIKRVSVANIDARRHAYGSRGRPDAQVKSKAGGSFIRNLGRKRPLVQAAAGGTGVVRHGVARAISRAGVCSRKEAATRVVAGRVRVDGRTVCDPEFPTTRASRIEVDGVALTAADRVYIMLNKPRGLVTSTSDERGRDTVYQCLDSSGLPWLAPVGRLDKASEGLLLMSNDSAWAAAVTEPAVGLLKIYHVKVDAVPDAGVLIALQSGIDESGEHLCAQSASIVRASERTAWLEIVLDEGRNRHIRRLLAAFDINVIRLIRVAIGQLALGDLTKGGWRTLSAEEVSALSSTSGSSRRQTGG